MADNSNSGKALTKTTDKPAINKANEHLPKEVAEHYEVINWQGSHRQNFGKFGIVDLKKMTLTKAAKLVATKFSKLKAK